MSTAVVVVLVVVALVAYVLFAVVVALICAANTCSELDGEDLETLARPAGVRAAHPS